MKVSPDEARSKTLPNTGFPRVKENSGQSKGEYVSRISYSLSNGRGNEIKTYRIVDDHVKVKTTNVNPMSSNTPKRETPAGRTEPNFSKDANNNGRDDR